MAGNIVINITQIWISLNITQIWISIIEQAHLSEMENGKTKHVAQDVAHSSEKQQKIKMYRVLSQALACTS